MLKLEHTRRLGLEVWIITLGGQELTVYLSEQYARARFERLRQEYERSAGMVVT